MNGIVLAGLTGNPFEGGSTLQTSNEITLFMQKAIYYVSKPIAARGMLELTDRRLLFQVFPFDASFGIKSLAIDLASISGVDFEAGDIHPRIVVRTRDHNHEFMLSKGRELYDRLKALVRNPLGQVKTNAGEPEAVCACGKSVSGQYIYCPWCGTKLLSA